MTDEEAHEWHARLVRWAAWSGNDYPAPLSRPGKPDLRVTIDEADAQHVDALMARLGTARLPVYAVWRYYRCRWWEDAIPGHRLLALHLSNDRKRMPWYRDWCATVGAEPGCSWRDKFDAAARRVLDQGVTMLHAEDRRGVARLAG